MKKVAVFLGDHFWSSTPYDGLNLYHELNKHMHTDLIAFNEDIRLNKEYEGWEKFHFDPKEFKVPNLRTVKHWDEVTKISGEYNLIICQAKVAPKTRCPFPPMEQTTSDGKSVLHAGLQNGDGFFDCPIAVWDIGGCDLLHNSVQFANYYFVKGPIWKEWLVKMGWPEKNVFVTGSPHYDYFFDSDKNVVGACISEQEFLQKYSLDKTKKKILLMPSNPSSHKEQFEKNLEELHNIVNLCSENDIELLVKTYPHDYVFKENEDPYTGIYRRAYTDRPQYEFMRDTFPSVKIIESQDHHAALKYSDKVFNMAGSHVAWETFYTNSVSYAIGYKDKKYYKQIPVLKHLDYISFPDDLMNVHMDDLTDIVHKDFKTEKEKCNDWFLNEVSIPNIVDAVKQIVATSTPRPRRWTPHIWWRT